MKSEKWLLYCSSYEQCSDPSFQKIHPDAVTPEYKTAGAAGFDLALVDDATIPPRSFVKAHTGIIVQVPDGHFLLIASRGSNPGKKGITLANSIGVLDWDYRGPNDEVMLCAWRTSPTPKSTYRKATAWHRGLYSRFPL